LSNTANTTIIDINGRYERVVRTGHLGGWRTRELERLEDVGGAALNEKENIGTHTGCGLTILFTKLRALCNTDRDGLTLEEEEEERRKYKLLPIVFRRSDTGGVTMLYGTFDFGPTQSSGWE